MKERYCADALIGYGPDDPQMGRDIDQDQYETFTGKTLKEAVKQAEAASLTDEAYLCVRQELDPVYGWDDRERYDCFDLQPLPEYEG